MQEDSGFERCHACDRKAAEEVGRTQVRRKYLCHAGLYEVALPVTEKRRTVATILFGQMLDDAPREEQWGELCFTDRGGKELPLGTYYRFVR